MYEGKKGLKTIGIVHPLIFVSLVCFCKCEIIFIKCSTDFLRSTYIWAQMWKAETGCYQVNKTSSLIGI